MRINFRDFFGGGGGGVDAAGAGVGLIGGAEPSDVGGDDWTLLGDGGVRGTVWVTFESALGVWGVGEFNELVIFPGAGGTSACVVLPDPGRTTGSGSFMLGFLLSAKLLYDTR